MSTTTEVYAGFGTCPDCGGSDGYINIGRSHWFYCDEHKTCWIGGHNLFTTWKFETEDEQRALYYEMDFGSFTYIANTQAEADEHDRQCPSSHPARVRSES